MISRLTTSLIAVLLCSSLVHAASPLPLQLDAEPLLARIDMLLKGLEQLNRAVRNPQKVKKPYDFAPWYAGVKVTKGQSRGPLTSLTVEAGDLGTHVARYQDGQLLLQLDAQSTGLDLEVGLQRGRVEFALHRRDRDVAIRLPLRSRQLAQAIHALRSYKKLVRQGLIPKAVVPNAPTGHK